MSILEIEKLPYIVHYCVSKQKCSCKDCQSEENEDDGGLFPTHTHGLDKLNYPEIFIDPLAFNKYNATVINGVYRYLFESDK